MGRVVSALQSSSPPTLALHETKTDSRDPRAE